MRVSSLRVIALAMTLEPCEILSVYFEVVCKNYFN